MYDVFQEAKVRPDAAVWNALIAAAGRAGQLQRAFEALQDMQVQFCSHSKVKVFVVDEKENMKGYSQSVSILFLALQAVTCAGRRADICTTLLTHASQN